MKIAHAQGGQAIVVRVLDSYSGVDAHAVSVSFGAVPAGSDQTRTYNMALTNLGNSQATFLLSVGSSTGTGVSYSVSPSSLELAAGASGTATMTMTATHGASAAGHQAKFAVSSGGGEVAHAVVFTWVR